MIIAKDSNKALEMLRSSGNKYSSVIKLVMSPR